jgi:NAD(P)-dependent dehydrogenase (short-subunit alcohol dehydrogenase family)
MSNQFTDKVIMITGAAGAIARGVVDRFTDEGAKLVLVDISESGLQELIDDMDNPPDDYLLLTGDLGKPENVDAIVNEAVENFGQIDALAHTAGGFTMGDPVHAVNMEAYSKMMYLNTTLTYVTLGRVAQHMVDAGVEGSLVAILARSGLSGSANMAAYTASKAAAQRIVESMSLELKDHGIRVNGVMPSTADTPANRASMPDADFDKWVTPAQIADAIAFLCSEDARAISGQSLGVYNRA